MDFNQIKELIEIIDKSSLREFNLKIDNADISMSKNTGNISPKEDIARNNFPAVKAGDMDRSKPVTILPSQEKEEKEGNIVKSPIVGMFYSKPAPEKPPFKSVGDRVEVGDVLCIIEAMKVMNEITSKYAGVLEEVMVENEAEVEFGQPLFRIK